jgi:hypothetical protein
VRLLRTAFLLTVLALAAVGCGSSEAEVPEVPGPPVELTVPHVKGAADLSQEGDATPTPTPTAEGGATATPAATADSGTTGSTGTGTGTNTGATTGGTDAAATPAPATQDPPTTDTAPPAGSAPEKFEQFCQENAGAC